MSKKSETKERLGIFVPVHKNYNYLKHMLDSLVSTKREIEVFILNNGSDDDTNKFCKILSRRKGFHVRHFPEALGVSRAWNMCLDWALEEELDLIVITNSDVVYHENCLDMMVKFMERTQSATLACALDIKKVEDVIRAFPFLETKAIAGTLYSPKAMETFISALNAVQSPTNDPQTISSSVDYSSFIVRPAELLEKVGYFDEAFSPAYWEDTDMHWRLAQVEHVTKTISNAYMLHVHSRTAIEGGLNLDVAVPNAFYFAKKHNITFANSELFKDPKGQVFAVKAPEASKAYDVLQTDPERRVFECLIFEDDLDALELHLEALYDEVEQFVIIEAPMSLKGKAKPLRLKANKERFARFAPKMRRLVLADFKDANTPEARRNMLLRSLPAGLKNQRFTDFILLSDIYSIPDIKKIKEFQRMPGVKILQQGILHSFLNLTDGKTIEGSRVCTVRAFLDDFGGDLANFALATGFKIPNGGWVLKKSKSIDIDRKVLNKTYKKIDLDYRHLSTIRKNPDKFAKWLWDPRRTNAHNGEAQIDITLYL